MEVITVGSTGAAGTSYSEPTAWIPRTAFRSSPKAAKALNLWASLFSEDGLSKISTSSEDGKQCSPLEI